MKKIMFFLLGIVCLFSNPSKAQKSIDKVLKSITPPNCVRIGNNLFMDQSEISNVHWLEFLAYLQEHQPEQYAANLPDTAVWASELSTNDSYIANYLRYPGFHYFPVVGVSYQQAVSFCAWRSKIVTAHFAQNKKNKYKDYTIEFVFSLPSAKQWEQAASANSDDPYGFVSLKPRLAKQYSHRANYNKGSSPENTIFITEYILAYPPNDLGLYNMIGNVAEMVAEEGIAKGGSWKDPLEACVITLQKSYEVPQSWLGFRCVCTIKITPKA